MERAERRLGSPRTRTRRRRSDRGKSRLPEGVQQELRRLLSGLEYPGIQSISSDLKAFCDENGHVCPSRATIYKYMARASCASHAAADLPPSARNALYNLWGGVQVPGAQLAFYCFNYGDLTATHFAAGLPWLSLYQAARMRGWRPRCRGLLGAVLAARGVGRA